MPLDNANQPTEPSLSEADRADMEVFLAHMLGMLPVLPVLPVLEVHAFEQAPAVALPVAAPGQPAPAAPTLLYCRGKGMEAAGYESTQGFVVRKGSQAVAEVVESMAQYAANALAMRQELIGVGVLAFDGGVYVMTQDHTFNSPSRAACVLLGRSANGRIEWKDVQGRTLKASQEAEAGG